MKSILLSFLIILCTTTIVSGQIPPDKEGLLNGDGMSQGMVADMNGYPGPKHVLDLADKLRLSDQQKKTVTQIYRAMEVRAKELGQRIVSLEEELGKAFVDKLVVEKSVRDDAEQIGRLRGRLRAVYLVAHLKTKEVLTDKQLSAYLSLRNSGKK